MVGEVTTLFETSWRVYSTTWILIINKIWYLYYYCYFLQDMNLFMCHIQQTLTSMLRPNRASPSVDVKVNTVPTYGRQNYNSALGKKCMDVTVTVESTDRVCSSLVKTTIVFMMRCLRMWFPLTIYLVFFSSNVDHFVLRGSQNSLCQRWKLWFHESFKCVCLLWRTLFRLGSCCYVLWCVTLP